MKKKSSNIHRRKKFRKDDKELLGIKVNLGSHMRHHLAVYTVLLIMEHKKKVLNTFGSQIYL